MGTHIVVIGLIYIFACVMQKIKILFNRSLGQLVYHWIPTTLIKAIEFILMHIYSKHTHTHTHLLSIFIIDFNSQFPLNFNYMRMQIKWCWLIYSHNSMQTGWKDTEGGGDSNKWIAKKYMNNTWPIKSSAGGRMMAF